MYSPTTASAILHSSSITIVGFLWTLKDNIDLNINILLYLLLLTSFFSFYDFKKLLALSTSLNMKLLFINSRDISYFHLINHRLI